MFISCCLLVFSRVSTYSSLSVRIYWAIGSKRSDEPTIRRLNGQEKEKQSTSQRWNLVCFNRAIQSCDWRWWRSRCHCCRCCRMTATPVGWRQCGWFHFEKCSTISLHFPLFAVCYDHATMHCKWDDVDDIRPSLTTRPHHNTQHKAIVNNIRTTTFNRTTKN